jgi:HSP20 family molecular chaperone IbpA
MKSRKAPKPKSNRRSVRLSLSEPAALQAKVQKLQLAIARRAHELFEARGQEHGHDLDDWLQAEYELLCPVSVAMSQSNDCVKLRADLSGFGQSDIEVSVEPGRVMILGKKAQKGDGTGNNRAEWRSSRSGTASDRPCHRGGARTRPCRIEAGRADL